jgi:hypothetical protein
MGHVKWDDLFCPDPRMTRFVKHHARVNMSEPCVGPYLGRWCSTMVAQRDSYVFNVKQIYVLYNNNHACLI